MTPIDIQTPDGTAPAKLFSPADGSKPTTGVIFYMDALSVRPSLEAMSQRLADQGHLVLLPNLFYRSEERGPFAPSDFATRRNVIMGLVHGTTQAMTASDSVAFVEALTKAGATGKIGTVGYCMGGGRAIRAAADFPERVAAAASFHGGGLASDAPDSPHLYAGTIKGRVYVGSAGIDGSFPPEQSAKLAEALRTAEVDYTIENYLGMAHGWTIEDHGVYDAAGSARHWKRLLELFGETLN